jgi:hypothetical protein
MTRGASQRERAERLCSCAAPRGLARKALLLTGISLALAVVGAPAASASAAEFELQAGGYGTQVTGPVGRSGPSAPVGIGPGCNSGVGLSNKNTALSVNVPPVLATGTIDTSGSSKATPTGVSATGTAATQSVSLLNGLVSATLVKAVSTTSYSSIGGFSVSPAGTSFVGLVVNGHPIAGTPPANTKITIPGVGYAILNQQGSKVEPTTAHLRVVGIHLVVTQKNPLAPLGTQLFVSVANSSVAGPAAGLLTGGAFGTRAHVGSTVISGPSFPQGLACLGTGGVPASNTGAGVTVPGLLSSGTITDTANGIVSQAQVFGETSSTVQNLNLLNGEVTAKVIKADVSATGNPPILGDTSSFVGLKVSGQPQITDAVPPNTELSLPNIGTLWLHRQVKTATGISVIMVELIVTNPNNPPGLAVGTTVDVGSANVGVR